MSQHLNTFHILLSFGGQAWDKNYTCIAATHQILVLSNATLQMFYILYALNKF